MRASWILFTILAIFIFICGCNYQNNQSKSLNIMSEKWKSDPGGCKGYRNISIAEQMVKDFNIVGKTKPQVIEFFGPPDSEGSFEYTYMLNRKCDDAGRIIQDTLDHCWLNIIFGNPNTVSQTGITCN